MLTLYLCGPCIVFQLCHTNELSRNNLIGFSISIAARPLFMQMLHIELESQAYILLTGAATSLAGPHSTCAGGSTHTLQKPYLTVAGGFARGARACSEGQSIRVGYTHVSRMLSDGIALHPEPEKIRLQIKYCFSFTYPGPHRILNDDHLPSLSLETALLAPLLHLHVPSSPG